MDTRAPAQAHHAEPDLFSVYHLLWRGWRLTLVAVIACLAISTLLLIIAPRLYTAQIVLGPSEFTQQTTDAAGALVRRLTPELIEQDGTPFRRMLDLIYSNTVATELLKDNRIARTIFADQWDSDTETWVPPDGALTTVRSAIYALFGVGGWKPPASTDLAQHLERNLRLNPTGESGLYELSYSHPDPNFAIYLLNRTHDVADTVVRETRLALANAQTDYVLDTLGVTANMDLRQALLSLLQSLTRDKVMTGSDLPYAAEVIDRSFASKHPTSPDPISYYALAIMFGLAIGGALSIFAPRLARRA